METIFSSSNNNGRNATRRSLYQSTPFGTPPLGRQVSYLQLSDLGTTCGGHINAVSRILDAGY